MRFPKTVRWNRFLLICPEGVNTLFREDSVCTKIVRTYLNIVGRNYLEALLLSTVRKISQTKEIYEFLVVWIVCNFNQLRTTTVAKSLITERSTSLSYKREFNNFWTLYSNRFLLFLRNSEGYVNFWMWNLPSALEEKMHLNLLAVSYFWGTDFTETSNIEDLSAHRFSHLPSLEY